MKRFILILAIHSSAFALPPCGTSILSVIYDCHGTQKDRNGNWYQGDFRNGKFHGLGMIQFANGDTFNGEFKENFVTQGIIKYANGETYDGEWMGQTFNGQGVYRYPVREDRNYISISIGEWKNGRPHGKHIQYDSNNCVLRSGVFELGLLKIFDTIDLTSFDKIKPINFNDCKPNGK